MSGDDFVPPAPSPEPPVPPPESVAPPPAPATAADTLEPEAPPPSPPFYRRPAFRTTAIALGVILFLIVIGLLLPSPFWRF